MQVSLADVNVKINLNFKTFYWNIGSDAKCLILYYFHKEKAIISD